MAGVDIKLCPRSVQGIPVVGGSPCILRNLGNRHRLELDNIQSLGVDSIVHNHPGLGYNPGIRVGIEGTPDTCLVLGRRIDMLCLAQSFAREVFYCGWRHFRSPGSLGVLQRNRAVGGMLFHRERVRGHISPFNRAAR